MPRLIRRFPWIFLGVLVCIALLHFIPALFNALSPVWPVVIEYESPELPTQPEIINVPPLTSAPNNTKATEQIILSETTMEEIEEEATRHSEELAEREAFGLINAFRKEEGAAPTKWNDKLYELSKNHTQEMADRGELFHTPMEADYGENCWGGRGYYQYNYNELAFAIVTGWMSSPLHSAWLLHPPINESVVSIVVASDGQYASWTFWTHSLPNGPDLVENISREWKATGGGMPWIDWLISKGYLDS